MRRLYLIMVGLLALLVVMAGCVNKQASEQPQQKTSGSALEGNITVPGEQDLLIEEAQTSPDETVDLGSLI